MLECDPDFFERFVQAKRRPSHVRAAWDHRVPWEGTGVTGGGLLLKTLSSRLCKAGCLLGPIGVVYDGVGSRAHL